MKYAVLSIAMLMAVPASAQDRQFPEATETDAQLVQYYQLADTDCSHVNKGDVRTMVGCIARKVYGQALNERGQCLGKEGEPAAEMKSHKCETDSLRFERWDVPKVER